MVELVEMVKGENRRAAEIPLSFNELVNLALQLNNRLDALWQRVLYAHAAIVGVMVFFGTQSNLFMLPRTLVFGFYSVNTVITIIAFRDTFSGLTAAIHDLREIHGGESVSNVENWIFLRDYKRNARLRTLVLLAVWAVLGYLLMYPVVRELLAS